MDWQQEPTLWGWHGISLPCVEAQGVPGRVPWLQEEAEKSKGWVGVRRARMGN